MSVKCWEIILASASSHLRSAHTYVNWTFPLGSVCNSKSLPVLCRAVNQCNPGDARNSQLAEGITYNNKPLQHRTPMGPSQCVASPALFLSSPAGLWSRSLCPPCIENTDVSCKSREREVQRKGYISIQQKTYLRAVCVYHWILITGRKAFLLQLKTCRFQKWKRAKQRKERREQSWDPWSFASYLADVSWRANTYLSKADKWSHQCSVWAPREV